LHFADNETHWPCYIYIYIYIYTVNFNRDFLTLLLKELLNEIINACWFTLRYFINNSCDRTQQDRNCHQPFHSCCHLLWCRYLITFHHYNFVILSDQTFPLLRRGGSTRLDPPLVYDLENKLEIIRVRKAL